jgi:hypothetical protein
LIEVLSRWWRGSGLSLRRDSGRSIEDEIDRTALHETKKFIVGVLLVSTVKGMIVSSSRKKLQKE